MIIEFDRLPKNARIWIFQSSRKFENDELGWIEIQLLDFLKNWNAHNQQLTAAFIMPYSQFIVIGLNQNLIKASGCSIDSLVHQIQNIEKKLNVDLIDKLNVIYKKNNVLKYVPISEFKRLSKAKQINSNTIVFNNLVNDKEEFDNQWEVPVKLSWHRRFVK